MAYDLSELKHDLTVLLENCERLIEYEQNNDISEEIRSRVYDAIKTRKIRLYCWMMK